VEVEEVEWIPNPDGGRSIMQPTGKKEVLKADLVLLAMGFCAPSNPHFRPTSSSAATPPWGDTRRAGHRLGARDRQEGRRLSLRAQLSTGRAAGRLRPDAIPLFSHSKHQKSMCGIVGIFNIKEQTPQLRQKALRMSQKIRHRGPD
jgi:hypothetical protein